MGPIVHRRDNTSAYIIGGIMLAIIAFSAIARAEKTMHAKEPSDRITAVQAVKAGKTGATVFKCRKSVVGASGNPVSAKGSAPSWHAKVGQDEAAAADIYESGKAVYLCDGMTYDSSRKRMVRAEY